ncbi:MAG: XamI family restriction endonuclease [Bacilli bacterium]|nr:XamI family restriction endonuclease [Bacilli bacterium]
MCVNNNKPKKWNEDIDKSVDMYNDWFMKFAPKAYRDTRQKTTKEVRATLNATQNLTVISGDLLKTNPSVLPSLRMSTCPPLAVDRLIGLSGVSKNLVRVIEKEKKLPPQMEKKKLDSDLEAIAKLIEKMADPDIFVWLGHKGKSPKEKEVYRAATIVADRLCGAVSNPIIRNTQEERQLEKIKKWLQYFGYQFLPANSKIKFNNIKPGQFAFRLNVPISHGVGEVNIPVDVVVKPKSAKTEDLPLLIEAKSAGDFTNVNKRRKEEAAKMKQLKSTYGEVEYILFLCGYFDSGYLGYEAAEGIDWVWEHRMKDLKEFGL